MKKKIENETVNKIILSPIQSSGDCGYQVVIIGLFYLALKATDDSKIASAINSSSLISKLLAKKPSFQINYLEKTSDTNQTKLLSYLNATMTTSIPSPTLTEILAHLTSQFKKLNFESTWLQNRIQQEIKSGLWLESHREWEKLPSFLGIKKKIQLKEDELYSNATANKANITDDLLNSIMFQAQISACETLSSQELSLAAKEVVSQFFSSTENKAWVDIDFLQQLVENLLGTSEMMFHQNGLKISGNGPSSNHWYIELPKDKYTNQFLLLFKKGYQNGLSIVVPQSNIEASISCYSSFFPQASDDDKIPLQSQVFTL